MKIKNVTVNILRHACGPATSDFVLNLAKVIEARHLRIYSSIFCDEDIQYDTHYYIHVYTLLT